MNIFVRFWIAFLSLFRSRKAQMRGIAAVAIIGAVIATAFAMVIGAVILGETQTIAYDLNMTPDANDTVKAMYEIVWPSLRLLPLQILVLVGAAIMAAVGLFLARR